jgi:MYXO-CTERM domain-containing protein
MRLHRRLRFIAHELCLAVAAVAVLTTARANADSVQLTLTALSDVSNVQAGQTVTIGVMLGNLLPSQSLGLLGTDLSITPAQASPVGESVPDLISGGGIVPGTAYFDGTSSAGQPQGNFDQDALFFQSLDFADIGPAITTNGEFFSFQLQPLSAGAVTVHFLDAVASDTSLNSVDVQLGDDLSFEVSSPSAAAPLPSAHLTSLALIALLVGYGVIRRRRSRQLSSLTQCFLVGPVAGLCILLSAAHAKADSILFQDNFDSGALSGWIAQSAGGNNGGQLSLVWADSFNPGQDQGHNFYALAANINVPSSTQPGFGFVILDHNLGASAVAGTTYNLNIDDGLLAENFGHAAPDVNYGVQLWASQPGTAGSALLWEMDVNCANQIMIPPAVGDWTTWSGAYTATSSAPGGELWLRLFSIGGAGATLPDAVAWDNVSVSTTAAPLPSALSGALGLAGVIAIASLIRRRSIGIQM